jgi:hypothetical protein
MLLFSVVAESSNAITTRYQPSPGSSPGAGLKRFASSELLKIETAKWLVPSRAEAKRKRTSCAFVWIQETGGGERDRTDDLLLAKQALSQLSYTPGSALTPSVVGLVGLEPTTPALSRRCSNQLSYRPSAYSSSGPGAARRHSKTTPRHPAPLAAARN